MVACNIIKIALVVLLVFLKKEFHSIIKSYGMKMNRFRNETPY